MQHIAVHSVKMSILRNIRTALKPGGHVTIQLAFNRHFPFTKLVNEVLASEAVKFLAFQREPRHARWRDEKVDATTTNSGCDGAIGEAELPQVAQDFASLYEDVRMWFFDLTHHRPDGDLSDLGRESGDKSWASHFLFVHGRKPESSF